MGSIYDISKNAMNPQDLFCFIGKNFTVDWNVDNVVSKINHYIVDLDAKKNGNTHRPVSNATTPSFQRYPNGVVVSPNFPAFFPNECINVCDKLTTLQKACRESEVHSILFEDFIKTKQFEPNHVRLMECNNFVRPHIDLRKYGINIGLKNSSNAVVSVSESTDPKNVYNKAFYQYRLCDGDVILINTHNAHWISPIDTRMKRYIISYNLKI